LFAFTSVGDCLAAKLRPGNAHSADGVLDFLDPIVRRYRSRFTLFWLRGDAAFADPEVYTYCEGGRVIYFIRLPANAFLTRLIYPYLARPAGRPPKSGIQVKPVDFRYQEITWNRERRVVAKIEWHAGELFPRIGFIVTNSRLSAGKVVKVYNGRGDVENRIKEGKNTLRWDKTSCRHFAANQARLLIGVLAFNLLHMLREFYLKGEEVKRSIERLIKVGAKVAHHARMWQAHVASAFPLAHHHRAVFGRRDTIKICLTEESTEWYAPILGKQPLIGQKCGSWGRWTIFGTRIDADSRSNAAEGLDFGAKPRPCVRSRNNSR
jgi:hypothetical protein